MVTHPPGFEADGNRNGAGIFWEPYYYLQKKYREIVDTRTNRDIIALVADEHGRRREPETTSRRHTGRGENRSLIDSDEFLGNMASVPDEQRRETRRRIGDDNHRSPHPGRPAR